MSMVLWLLVTALCCVHAGISPMPYRVGYGIGSIMPPDVISSMKKEAGMRARVQLASKMNSDADSVERELVMAANPVTNSQDSSQAIPNAVDPAELAATEGEIKALKLTLFKEKMAAYDSLWELQLKQLDDLTAAAAGGSANGAPTTFASGAESPIDWSLCEVSYYDRGFDSIDINSKFYRTETNGQRQGAVAMGQAVSEGVSGDGDAQKGTTPQMKSSVGAKVAAAHSAHTIEYTLLLTAFATHRFVKQLNTVVVDPDRLRKAWNKDFPSNTIPNPAMEPVKFLQTYIKARASSLRSAAGGSLGQEKLAILTETFQCSALVGMVHFIKSETTDSVEGAFSQSGGSAESISQKLSASLKASAATGNTEFAQESARKLAAMTSGSSLQVTFDLVSQGYIPTLKSSQVSQTVKAFKDFDPAKFSASDLTGGSGSTGKEAEKMNQQQSNMAAVIKATMMGTEDKTTEVSVLDLQTFMTAFNDFTKGVKTLKGAGVPCGMNVKQFSFAEVVMVIAEKYLSQNQLLGKDDEKKQEA